LDKTAIVDPETLELVLGIQYGISVDLAMEAISLPLEWIGSDVQMNFNTA
jgi:hypothetical protein